MATKGMQRTLKADYQAVLDRLPDLLKAEGFGVLTRIDVKSTLKEKLGVDFRRYQILGACNPKFAHQALGMDLAIGVALPCNFVVHENDGGGTTVIAVDPNQTIAAGDPRLEPVAAEVRQALLRVLDALGR